MKRVWVLSLLISFTLADGFSGYLQNWTAIRTGEGNDILLNRNRFRSNYGITTGSGMAWSSIDFTSNGNGTGDELEMNVRELYLDLFLGKWDLRIGKQQVVWGKVDGVFVNDIVNPFDLRFFLLQDFEDIRIGNSMVKATRYFGSSNAEFLWIPVFKEWQFADPGTPWGPPNSGQMEMNGALVSVERGEAIKPSAELKNSEWGFRYSTFIFGADISLLYLDAFQDRSLIQFSGMSMQPSGLEINVNQVYRRSPMYGMNFARPVGGLLIRGEGAIFKNAPFNILTSNQQMPIGETNSDYFQAAMGLDLSGPLGTSVSFQYLTKQVLDYSPEMLNTKENKSLLTAMISGSFWNENGSARILTLLDQENNSGIVNSSFTYKASDHIKFETGYINIWGETGSSSSQFNFGLFDRNDLVYFKLTYSY